MRTKTSYDTSIKHLYREGLEELIAPSIRKNIPRSTIHRWRPSTGSSSNLMGHSSSKTSKIYTQVTIKNIKGIESPFDSLNLDTP